MKKKLAILFLILIFAIWAGSATAAERDDDWAAIRGFLSQIKGVATAPLAPAGLMSEKFTTGMLLGNGDIGVVVGGTTTTQKFFFGKGDFLGQALDVTKNTWGDSILPIGVLSINCPTPQTGSRAREATRGPSYLMEQDILNAEVRTTMRLGGAVVHMRSWTADSENTFVTEFTNPDGPAVTIGALLQENNEQIYPATSGVTGGAAWVTRENDNRGVLKARVALAMKLEGARYDSMRAGDVPGVKTIQYASGSFKLEPGATVRLIVTVAGDTKLKTAACASVESLRESALKRAAALDGAGVDKLHQDHLDWWKNYWLKSYIRVNDDVLEKFYYGAQYVMGSAARPGKFVPSMWGMWMTTDTPRWGGRHFFNYNAQGPYYGVCSSNHPEQILPYSEFVTAQLPIEINKTARAGYKGACWQRSFQPLCLFLPKPQINQTSATKDWRRLQTDQKSNGAFAAMPMIMYYEYTMDREFLKTKLYPFLKEIDAFHRDFIDKEAVAGGGYRYVMNHTGAHELGNAAAATDVNANLDLGFIRTVCRVLMEGSQELGVDAEMRPVWQDLVDHLSEYPTREFNGKTCFVNAEPGGRIDMRGQPVCMEGAVHPGENVALGGDPKWIQIGLNSLEYMAPWGITGGSQNNGFCKEWLMATRLGWPAEDLIEKFKPAILHLWRESNLTCFQGGGGIETCGTTDAVNTMLLQSNFGQIRVFPVWPVKKDAMFKRLRAKGAFLVSSELKGGKVTYVEITSEKGGMVKLVNPWVGTKIGIEEAGKGMIEPKIEGEFITFKTNPGATYRIVAK